MKRKVAETAPELLIKQLDVLGALEQWSAAPARTS
jgi:hypothetical protein